MKPLNQAERNNAFLRFLLLFLVTIAVIVAVVFFSIDVPLKESDHLRKELLVLKKQQEVADSLGNYMKEATEYLGYYDANKESPEATFRRVKNKVDDMYELVKQIPKNDKIYGLSVQNLQDLNQAKSELSRLKPK